MHVAVSIVPDDAKERLNRINDASPARHRDIGASVHRGHESASAFHGGALHTPAYGVHSSRALLPAYRG